LNGELYVTVKVGVTCWLFEEVAHSAEKDRVTLFGINVVARVVPVWVTVTLYKLYN
jgi:hypothetical protein